MRPHAVFHADLAEGPPEGRAWDVAAADGIAAPRRDLGGGRARHGPDLPRPQRACREIRPRRPRPRRPRLVLGRDRLARAGPFRPRAGAGALGHVNDFADYQADVAALLATVRAAGLPEPFHLLAHSMGGAIGLRALAEGLPVGAAAFSAPMWGLQMAVYLRPFARGAAAVGRRAGLGLREVPVGRRESYLAVTPFDANALTTCPETYAWMVAQTRRDPRLALGRPTFRWLHAAMADLRALRRLPRPRCPVLVGLAGAGDHCRQRGRPPPRPRAAHARIETYAAPATNSSWSAPPIRTASSTRRTGSTAPVPTRAARASSG
jgi:lysophospholipase